MIVGSCVLDEPVMPPYLHRFGISDACLSDRMRVYNLKEMHRQAAFKMRSSARRIYMVYLKLGLLELLSNNSGERFATMVIPPILEIVIDVVFHDLFTYPKPPTICWR